MHVYLFFFFIYPLKMPGKYSSFPKNQVLTFPNRIASPYMFHPKSSLHKSPSSLWLGCSGPWLMPWPMTSDLLVKIQATIALQVHFKWHNQISFALHLLHSWHRRKIMQCLICVSGRRLTCSKPSFYSKASS